jgi:hypothetical protein
VLAVASMTGICDFGPSDVTAGGTPGRRLVPTVRSDAQRQPR